MVCHAGGGLSAPKNGPQDDNDSGNKQTKSSQTNKVKSLVAIAVALEPRWVKIDSQPQGTLNGVSLVARVSPAASQSGGNSRG